MTNYERIKQKSVEEMAEFLNKIRRSCGGICKKEVSCFDCDCEIGIKQWLESEADNEN